MKLPALPKFSGDDRDDVDSLKRLLTWLEKHAELQCWTEQMYEVLPSHVKENYVKATEALQERLNPVEREALVSAQLMHCKQQPNEMGLHKIWRSCLSIAMGAGRGWNKAARRC